MGAFMYSLISITILLQIIQLIRKFTVFLIYRKPVAGIWF